ncbi:hypothetical protein [Peribacillus aracenensis]|uniref:hypothetical protein n=1 Tax=Peribacillus aracenensis TaxID=2976708 RepID=UPI0021A83C50|nr:hypothetical protein [Peribacillus sp. BBB004]
MGLDVTRDFRNFTREFGANTREFRAFTREFGANTREFRANTREFHAFTREFRANTREFGEIVWVKSGRAMPCSSWSMLRGHKQKEGIPAIKKRGFPIFDACVAEGFHSNKSTSPSFS